MFKHLYYRFRFGSYLKNAHGIKKFGERSMGELIRRVTKKSAFYREMNENLMVERANLQLRSDELQEQPMLGAGEFFSVQRRLRADIAVVAVFVVTAVFLNLFAVATLAEGESLLFNIFRWVAAVLLALVLTGGGLVVTERLIDSVMSFRQNPKQAYEISPIGLTFLWGSLLAGIEVAILGVADVQARALVENGGTDALYYGYLVLAMILPVVAGALQWDAMRFLDAYKTTQALREIESRLAQIDSILRQNDEYESNFYKLKSISYWDWVNEFKTYKDNLNEKRGVTESLKGHFARSYDAFQQEASKRYDSDIRDLTSKSPRKLRPEQLNRHEASQGDGTTASMPAASLGDQSSPSVNGADAYFEPKPIR